MPQCRAYAPVAAVELTAPGPFEAEVVAARNPFDDDDDDNFDDDDDASGEGAGPRATVRNPMSVATDDDDDNERRGESNSGIGGDDGGGGEASSGGDDDAAAGPMLCLRCLDSKGTNFPVALRSACTVGDLKAKLSERNGDAVPPPRRQRLIYGGRQLGDDNETLASAKVKATARLHASGYFGEHFTSASDDVYSKLFGTQESLAIDHEVRLRRESYCHL